MCVMFQVNRVVFKCRAEHVIEMLLKHIIETLVDFFVMCFSKCIIFIFFHYINYFISTHSHHLFSECES